MHACIFRFTDILCKLIKTNFYIARRQLLDKAINIYIWAFCSLFVMGYVMQAFGLATDYGNFQLGTVIGTIGLFEVYGNCFRCIADIEGERHISWLNQEIGKYSTLSNSIDKSAGFVWSI